MSEQVPRPRPLTLDDGPTGHIAWGFTGVAQFAARASRFLAAGVERAERLLFIADDPRGDQWPRPLLDSGQLQLSSVTEVYGEDGRVDATAQRATFAEALADALTDGYSGIRVAADNTWLASGGRLDSWMAWERVADRFMAENPVTGLCAFDRARLADDVMARVMGAHRTHLAA